MECGSLRDGCLYGLGWTFQPNADGSHCSQLSTNLYDLEASGMSAMDRDYMERMSSKAQLTSSYQQPKNESISNTDPRLAASFEFRRPGTGTEPANLRPGSAIRLPALP
eukprot:3101899-Pyramimonas_sp.AAC.1